MGAIFIDQLYLQKLERYSSRDGIDESISCMKFADLKANPSRAFRPFPSAIQFSNEKNNERLLLSSQVQAFVNDENLSFVV